MKCVKGVINLATLGLEDGTWLLWIAFFRTVELWKKKINTFNAAPETETIPRHRSPHGTSYKFLHPYKMPTLLLAFDFDHTIIDDNSDTVVRGLLKEKPTTSYSSCGWTSYMQEIFTMLAAQGTTESQIRKAVVDLREVEGFSDLMESLQDLDAEVIIISDSNEYFIHHWLVGKGIVEKVKKVFTNPAKFVGGELKIEKYHVQDWCQNSTENLCKGYILENYINERKCDGVVFDQVFYIGDGQNDYCPSTKLREIDVTFPRVGYALQKKLDQLLAVGGKTGVLATIHPWTTHNDILTFIRAPAIWTVDGRKSDFRGSKTIPRRFKEFSGGVQAGRQLSVDTIGFGHRFDLGVIGTLKDPRQGRLRGIRSNKIPLKQYYNEDGHYMFNKPGDLMFKPSFGPTNQAVRLLS
ncbi:hypothetical protein GE061_007656 [Apolygus lucorum]|uniref:Uncharacterized protein n=1 Tax=Apolygus lucorum TaxID=248454 RepID=A0A8S9WNV2_APOLU|nr:hypothetical protein GE061_007656 [Apolygus lucorum]